MGPTNPDWQIGGPQQSAVPASVVKMQVLTPYFVPGQAYKSLGTRFQRQGHIHTRPLDYQTMYIQPTASNQAKPWNSLGLELAKSCQVMQLAVAT